MKITIQCTVCLQKLRVPFTLKKLRVTCPKCGSQFYYQVKMPDFFNKIKNWFGKISIPKKKHGYINYGYTDIHSSENVKKIFVIWMFVILFLLTGSLILNYFNKQSFNKRFIKQYQKQIEQQMKQQQDSNTDNDVYL